MKIELLNQQSSNGENFYNLFDLDINQSGTINSAYNERLIASIIDKPDEVWDIPEGVLNLTGDLSPTLTLLRDSVHDLINTLETFRDGTPIKVLEIARSSSAFDYKNKAVGERLRYGKTAEHLIDQIGARLLDIDINFIANDEPKRTFNPIDISNLINGQFEPKGLLMPAPEDH
jgi:hypothetical protein